MPNLGQMLKASRWWDFKLPPLLAIAYYLLGQAVPPVSIVPVIGVWALFIIASIGIAGFGHLLNDVFDMKSDVLSGAENRAARRRSRRWLWLAVLLTVAWVPWLWIPLDTLGLILLLAEFGLFAAYSIPPLRLKTRGLLGALADALYAHVIPVLVAISVFGKLSGVEIAGWLYLLLTVWSLATGLRHIAQHQLIDWVPDRQAQIQTFVVRYGWRPALSMVSRYILPIEILSFLTLLGVFSPNAPWIGLGFLIFVAWELYKMRAVWFQPLTNPFRLDPAGQLNMIGLLILSRFYEGWLPTLMLITLILRAPVYLVLAGLHLLLFRQNITQLFSELPLLRIQRPARNP